MTVKYLLNSVLQRIVKHSKNTLECDTLERFSISPQMELQYNNSISGWNKWLHWISMPLMLEVPLKWMQSNHMTQQYSRWQKKYSVVPFHSNKPLLFLCQWNRGMTCTLEGDNNWLLFPGRLAGKNVAYFQILATDNYVSKKNKPFWIGMLKQNHLSL